MSGHGARHPAQPGRGRRGRRAAPGRGLRRGSRRGGDPPRGRGGGVLPADPPRPGQRDGQDPRLRRGHRPGRGPRRPAAPPGVLPAAAPPGGRRDRDHPGRREFPGERRGRGRRGQRRPGRLPGHEHRALPRGAGDGSHPGPRGLLRGPDPAPLPVPLRPRVRRGRRRPLRDADQLPGQPHRGLRVRDPLRPGRPVGLRLREPPGDDLRRHPGSREHDQDPRGLRRAHRARAQPLDLLPPEVFTERLRRLDRERLRHRGPERPRAGSGGLQPGQPLRRAIGARGDRPGVPAGHPRVRPRRPLLRGPGRAPAGRVLPVQPLPLRPDGR